MSKNEGTITAAALIGLMTVRWVVTLPAGRRRRAWWRPTLVGVAPLAAIGVWPLLMKALHVRGESTTLSSSSTWPSRAHASFDGMVPYLHVVDLAAPLAIVGGLVLTRVRRNSGAANDLWGWAALAAGIATVGAAFVTGSGDIQPWLLTAVHRVTEFPSLLGWWIVALWAVVASGAPFAAMPEGRRRSGEARRTGMDTSPDGGVNLVASSSVPS
jgi:hypothetical protein